MKEYDYAEAQTEFGRIISVYLRETGESPLHEREAINTIRHALRFAEKMMQEPNEDMKLRGLRALVNSIVSKNWTNEQLLKLSEEDRRHYKEMDAHRAIQTSDEAIAVFKAMRDAALKELGE